MNRFRRLGAVVLTALPLAGFAMTASAQNTSAVRFGASAGLSMPAGDLGKATDAGYVVAGHIWLSPARAKQLRFRGDVTFDQWNYSGNVDASWKALGFIANAVYDFPTSKGSTAQPYLLGGAGLYSQRYTVSGKNLDDSDLGIQAGGGLTFHLSGFDTFLEAKFVNVFGSQNSNWIPITFGIRF